MTLYSFNDFAVCQDPHMHLAVTIAFLNKKVEAYISKFFNPLTSNDELSRYENLTFLRGLDTEVGT